MRLGRLFGAPAVAIFASSVAMARGPVASSALAPSPVEVGQPFSYQLTLPGQESTGGEPTLRLPRGVRITGTQLMPRSEVSIINGVMSRSQSLVVRWSLVADEPGNYRVGPGSYPTPAGPAKGSVETVQVFPEGKGPARRRGRSLFDDDFFSLLPGHPGSMGGMAPSDPMDRLPTEVPPFFQRATTPNGDAFVAVDVEPKNPVVGQQVRLRAIAYGGRGVFEEGDSTDPSREGFLTVPVLDNSQGQPLYAVNIGERRWAALQVREYLLFPLRAGKETIGPMKVLFAGPGYQRSPGVFLQKESLPVELEVSDPPLAGRPANYRVGDVGSFQLRATVEPRTLTAGSSLSVQVVVEGAGQLPPTLPVPQADGVTWLQPTVRDQLGVDEGRYGGRRRYGYVVRVERPGKVDLGEFRWSFYDPEARAYRTVGAALGSVDVKPGGVSPTVTASAEPWERRLSPSPELGPTPEPLRPEAPRWFLAVMGLVPGALLLGRGGLHLTRWLGQRRRVDEGTPGALGRELLRTLRGQNVSPGNAREFERLLFLSWEHAYGLRARALAAERLRGELERAGCPSDRAVQAVASLEGLSALRYLPDDPGWDAARSKELWDSAAQLLRQKSPRRAGGGTTR